MQVITKKRKENLVGYILILLLLVLDTIVNWKCQLYWTVVIDALAFDFKH